MLLASTLEENYPYAEFLKLQESRCLKSKLQQITTLVVN